MDGAVHARGASTTAHVCGTCHGARLNSVALQLRFADHSIASLTAKPVQQLGTFFDKLRLNARASMIARDALAEIRAVWTFCSAWAWVSGTGSCRPDTLGR